MLDKRGTGRPPSTFPPPLLTPRVRDANLSSKRGRHPAAHVLHALLHGILGSGVEGAARAREGHLVCGRE